MQVSDLYANFESINDIISKYTTTTLDKINIYGVITFIGPANSTKNNSKLK